MAYLIKQINAPTGQMTTSEAPLPWSAGYPVEQTHTSIPAGMTYPAIGATVTAVLAPLPTATDHHFIAGDNILTEQVDTDGSGTLAGWFSVDSVAGDSVTLVAIEYAPGVSAGAALAAGQTEITGQTRLPTPPSGVTEGIVIVQAGAELLSASIATESPYYLASNLLLDRFGLFEAGFQPNGSPQIDLSNRLGSKLFDTGEILLSTPDDIANFRARPFAPLALSSYMEVWYR